MKMPEKGIISGSGMAVLLGFLAIVFAIFFPDIDFNGRIIFGVIGVIMIMLGLKFSRG